MANTKITTNVIADGAITSAKLDSSSLSIPSTATATTQSAGDNSTKVATTAYVETAVSNLVSAAPAALDTLDELAAALGDDANFATTVTDSLALKAPLASPDFTGDVTFDTSTLVVDSTNNRVGIGTSSPSDLLQVGGDSNGIIRITGAGTGVDFGLTWASNQANIFSNTSEARLTFKTNGSEHMRISSSGNVGIGTGTNNPSTKFEIINSEANDVSQQIGNSRAYGVGQGTHGAALLLGKQESGTYQGMGAIRGRPSTEDSSTNGNLIFDTRSGGSLTERMRLDSSGALLVGTTDIGSGTGCQIKNEAFDVRIANGYSLFRNVRGDNAGTALQIDRNTGDGNLIDLGRSNTIYGHIGVIGNDIYINSTDEGRLHVGGTGRYSWSDTLFGPQNDNARDLGSSGARWKDAHLSGNLYCGGQIELPINSSIWMGNTADSGYRFRLHGTSTGNSYIDWGEAGSLYFRSGQNTSANRMSLDSSGNLTLYGGALYVGGTAAANALDDYEEGTWTPKYNSVTNFSSAHGHYQKIGNRVFFSFYIQMFSSSNANRFQCVGLPFNTTDFSTNPEDDANRGFMTIGYTNYGSAFTVLLDSPSTDTFAAYTYGGAGITLAQLSGKAIYGAGSYITSS